MGPVPYILLKGIPEYLRQEVCHTFSLRPSDVEKSCNHFFDLNLDCVDYTVSNIDSKLEELVDSWLHTEEAIALHKDLETKMPGTISNNLARQQWSLTNQDSLKRLGISVVQKINLIRQYLLDKKR